MVRGCGADRPRDEVQMKFSRLDRHPDLRRNVFSVEILPTDLWEDGVAEDIVAPERDPWFEADQNGVDQDDILEWLPDEPSRNTQTREAESQDEATHFPDFCVGAYGKCISDG